MDNDQMCRSCTDTTPETSFTYIHAAQTREPEAKRFTDRPQSTKAAHVHLGLDGGGAHVFGRGLHQNADALPHDLRKPDEKMTVERGSG